jgi:hypothetical protein
MIIMQAPATIQQPISAAAPAASTSSGGGSGSAGGFFSILILGGLVLLIIGVLVSNLGDIAGEPNQYDYDMEDNEDMDKWQEDRSRHLLFEDQMQGYGSVIKAAAGSLLIFAMISEGVGKGKLSNGVKIALVAGSALIASQFFGLSLF